MFRPQEPSCGAYRHWVWTAPSSCPRPVAAAGLYFNGSDHQAHRWSVWWAFACSEHAGELIAARPLLDRDHAEVARRRDMVTHWTPGNHVKPLASGRPAAELVDRARRWAAANPEQAFTTPAPAEPADPHPAHPGRPIDAYAPPPFPPGQNEDASGGSSPEPPA